MSIRRELRVIAAELGRKNKSYDHNEVIAELRRSRPELIRAAGRSLENMALRRMLNDIESKQLTSRSLSHFSLFPELAGLPLSLPIPAADVKRGSKRLYVEYVTVQQAREAADKKPTPKVESRHKRFALRKFLDDTAHLVISDTDDLAQLALRLREEQKRE